MANTKELRLKIAEEDTTVITGNLQGIKCLSKSKIEEWFQF